MYLLHAEFMLIPEMESLTCMHTSMAPMHNERAAVKGKWEKDRGLGLAPRRDFRPHLVERRMHPFASLDFCVIITKIVHMCVCSLRILSLIVVVRQDNA